MAINYIELLEKFNTEIDGSFEKEITNFLETQREVFDLFIEEMQWGNPDFIDEYEKCIKNIPSKLRVLKGTHLDDFIPIYSNFTSSLCSKPTKLKKCTKVRLNEFRTSDIVTLLNEIAFYYNLNGDLKDSRNSPVWYRDIPLEVRVSPIFSRKLNELLNKQVILEENALHEKIDETLEFLHYLSEVHGYSSLMVEKIENEFDNIIVWGPESISTFEINEGNFKINISCNETVFFIIYFSQIFKNLYKCNGRESNILVSHLYDQLFYSEQPLNQSANLQDLIKKKIKRGCKEYKSLS